MRGSGAVVSTSDGVEEKKVKVLNCVRGCFELGQKVSDFDGQNVTTSDFLIPRDKTE